MLTIAEGAMYEAIHVHTLTFLHVFSVRRLLCLLSKVCEPAYAGGGRNRTYYHMTILHVDCSHYTSTLLI